MAGRMVSTVRLDPVPAPVADLTSPDAAAFGVTGELSAGNDYEVSAAWAQALFDAGHAALLYLPRFTPGGERALAVFGAVIDPLVDPDAAPPAPLRPSPVSAQPLVDAVEALGYRVARSVIPSTPAMSPDDDAEPEGA